MKIIAKQDTVIKAKPVQSSELSNDEKFDFKKGEELSINWLKKQDGHYLFELVEAQLGRYNWNGYPPHLEHDAPNVEREITNEQVKEIADEFGVEYAAAQAFMDVEAAGEGFDNKGRCKILFEAHWFGYYTGDIYNTDYPDLSCTTWSEARQYYNQDQWDRLERAIALNREAGLKSASWGIGQVMGFNYDKVGYSTVEAFVEDMKLSEYFQFKAMLNYVKIDGILPYLTSKNWREVARRYNGEHYEKNGYHTKFEKAYSRYSF